MPTSIVKYNVDVVIPVYNEEKFIEEAIISVLTQKYVPKLIIVVDDFSNDGTSDILKKFGKSIYVIRHRKNLGLPTARNTGIKNTKSNLIAFLDADDKWAEDKIKKQVEEFKNYPEIGLCYTDVIDCDAKLKPKRYGRKFKRRKSEFVFKELYLDAFPIPPSTVLARREVFDDCGLFNESMLKAQDYECWLRIAMKYPISCIDEPLCYRRDNPASISRTSDFEKSIHYSYRCFELCAEAARIWKVELPLSVEERKKLYLYRSCRESIIWEQDNDTILYHKMLTKAGGMGAWRNVFLRLLKFKICIKRAIKYFFGKKIAG